MKILYVHLFLLQLLVFVQSGKRCDADSECNETYERCNKGKHKCDCLSGLKRMEDGTCAFNIKPNNGDPISQWKRFPKWPSLWRSSICLKNHPSDTCSKCVTHKITIGLLYYNEPKLLRKTLQGWYSWDIKLRNLIDFVIVDDTSDAESAALPILQTVTASIS